MNLLKIFCVKWAGGIRRTKRKKAVNTQLQLDFFEQRIYNLLLQGDFSIEGDRKQGRYCVNRRCIPV